MSQRNSGYIRKERDAYQTPDWVTEIVLPYIPIGAKVLEPAAGHGKMATVLRRGHTVVASDIELSLIHDRHVDFLDMTDTDCNAIVTNPPYNLATEFIEHALRLTRPHNGFVAMLLRTDFDHASTRSKLFRDCSAFAMKIVLIKRIQWFEDSTGAPSSNHAWFVWDWTNEKIPTIHYQKEMEGRGGYFK